MQMQVAIPSTSSLPGRTATVDVEVFPSADKISATTIVRRVTARLIFTAILRCWEQLVNVFQGTFPSLPVFDSVFKTLLYGPYLLY